MVVGAVWQVARRKRSVGRWRCCSLQATRPSVDVQLTMTVTGAAGRVLLQQARRRRERELAGDHRAGSWARGRARAAQHRYVRLHWRSLALFALVLLAPALLAAVFIPDALARGFLLGAATAGVGGALTVWVLQVTGTAPAMMGDLAEQWTASELRPLRRRGWRLVNHVRLRRWDIDHVLVGPGGALAVETKWSASPWVLKPPEERVLRAVRQARGNADDLQRWAEFRRAGVSRVQPVVVLWGSGSGQLQVPPGGLQIDGVTVVPGPAAQHWRDGLPELVLLTPAQVEVAWQGLDRHTRLRDQRDPEPLPASVGRVIGVVGGTVGCALLAVVVAAGLLTLLGSVYVWMPVCLGLVALCEPFRRRPRTRLPALGCQVGLVGMLTATGAAWLLA